MVAHLLLTAWRFMPSLHRIPQLLCVLFTIISLNTQAQEIYQHTLDNGEIVFSDSPAKTGAKNSSPIKNSKQLIQADHSGVQSSITNSLDGTNETEPKFKTLGTTKVRADKLMQLKEKLSRRYASRYPNQENFELISSTMIEYRGEMYKRLEFKYGNSTIIPWLDSGNRIFKLHQQHT